MFWFRSSIIDFYSSRFLSSNVSDLQKKNSELENENAYLKILIQNATITQSFSETGIIDPIIANGTFFDRIKIFYSDIILNKGEKDGVKTDSLVFVRGAKPVGTIKEVTLSSSKLSLFTSYKRLTEGYITTEQKATSSLAVSSSDEQMITVEVENKSTSTPHSKSNITSIELIGDGSFGFYSKVLDSYSINEGDQVYLKNYPSLVIAVVQKIEDIPNENEKMIYFKSNFSNNNIRLFFIEK